MGVADRCRTAGELSLPAEPHELYAGIRPTRARPTFRSVSLVRREGEASIVESILSGTLDDEGFADTCEIWRKTGPYRYELKARGTGVVRFLVEAHQPPGGPGPEAGGEWRPIAEASKVDGGTHQNGTITVPEVRLGSSVSADFVRIRVRVSRVAGSGPVTYEFSMEPGA